MESTWVFSQVKGYKEKDLCVIVRQYTDILEQDIRFITSRKKRRKCAILLCKSFPVSMHHFSVQIQIKSLHDIQSRSIGFDELKRVDCCNI